MYRTAEEVVVWLGCEFEGSRKIMGDITNDNPVIKYDQIQK
jgi:hypothetical protein